MKRKLFYLSICFTLLAIQNIFGQSGGNNSLQIYTPEAYALARYGDIPVDISTGVPEISIPLMSISDRDISLDVSLSYHATGIKVDQEATWVGLGWVLNAGGIITRQVRGIKDGYSTINGKFTERPVIPDYDGIKPYSQYLSEIYPALAALSEQYSRDTSDGEPDIFYYNFCGKSGKFFLDNDAKAIFFKDEDFKAELTNENNSKEKFTIIDNAGIKYEFFQYNALSSGEYLNDWYLTKITSPSGGEINFEYNNSYYDFSSYRTYSTCFIQIGSPHDITHYIDYVKYHGSFLSGQSTYNYLLSKIITKSGNYINFNRSTTGRLDGENSANKALEEIVMYNNKNEMQKK